MKASPFLVRWLFLTAVLALVAVSPVLAGNVVPAGVDLWATAGEGRTYTSFASEPIPAGFFCTDSKPFTGRIVFQGAPVAAEPAASLGGADTIVRRLDNATFNDKGEASTRIQMMALSLVSVAPVDTGCGLYNVGPRSSPASSRRRPCASCGPRRTAAPTPRRFPSRSASSSPRPAARVNGAS